MPREMLTSPSVQAPLPKRPEGRAAGNIAKAQCHLPGGEYRDGAKGPEKAGRQDRIGFLTSKCVVLQITVGGNWQQFVFSGRSIPT